MRNTSKTAACPLSPAQGGILLSSLDLAGTAYLEQPNWILEGVLDVPAFSEAWSRTQGRFENLRTAIELGAKPRPLQVIHDDVPTAFAYHDWRDVPAAAQEDTVRQFLREDRARGFDLEHPPLSRVTLIRLADDRHLFLWTLHHVISDGWSATLVMRSLFAEYAALVTGRRSDRAPVIGFREYVAWLDKQDWREAEAYWRRELEGFTGPNRIMPRSAYERDRGWTPELALASVDDNATAAWRITAKRERLTLSTMFHGAWAACIARWSGDSDVVFGAVTAARPSTLKGVEEIAGPFASVIPVRARIRWGEVTADSLRVLQAQGARNREYAYAAAANIQRWAAPWGEELFETLVSFQNFPGANAFSRFMETEAAGSGLSVSDGFAYYSFTEYPLELAVLPHDDRIDLALHFDPAYLTTDDASSLLREVETILTSFAADPSSPWRRVVRTPDVPPPSLALATGEETAPLADVRGVHELLDRWVSEQPSAVAVEGVDGTLTFLELDARSRRLAAALNAAGVGSDVVVAVCTARACSLVVALLAVWRAGGGVLLTDVNDPPARIREAVEAAGARVAVVDADGRNTCADLACPFVDVAACGDPSRLARPVGDGCLAYVVYTSGSSGRPKAVLVEHRALLDHALKHLAPLYSRLERRPLRVGGAAPVCFDAFFDLILPMLASGHTLVLMSEDARLDLSAYVNPDDPARSLDVVDAAPSQLKVLMQHGLVSSSHAPRLILFGGEAIDNETWAALRASGIPAVNMYGATECTIDTTAIDVSASDWPVVGPAIGAERLYALDDELELVPDGVIGDFYVGGSGVARCYANAPRATASAFVPDPYGLPGQRMYRTGDRGRVNRNGVLEHCGRADDQLKVRGFRVEPAEIEAVLRERPDVADAVVVSSGGAQVAAALVAFVVPVDVERGGEAAWRRDLQQGLRQRLPAHLVPARIVAIEEVPLTSNGKLDRRSLETAAASSGSAATASAHVPPRTRLERTLCEIWRDVLGVDDVGVEDDFYELGGHSLLAISIVARLETMLERRIAVRALLERRTIAGLADELEEAASAPASHAPVVRAPRSGMPVPVPPAQRGLWFLDRLTPANPFYNVPYILRLRGKLDRRALRSALLGLLERHEVLRARFCVVDGAPTIVVDDQSPLELTLAHIAADSEDERRSTLLRHIETVIESPFDLAEGPLLRASLCECGPEDHVLVMVFHHIAVDGWSMKLIAEDLRDGYLATVGGRRQPAAGDWDYLDFAVWQLDAANDIAVERALSYWQQKLAGVAHAALPVDRERPSRRSYAGASLTFELDAELISALRRIARDAGATLFIALLAGLKMVIARAGGGEDIIVGVPTAGRPRQEFGRVVGMFANSLPLRTDLAGEPSYSEVLRRVTATAFEAYEHDVVPFEMIVARLGVVRDPSRNPLFQVLFQTAERGGGSGELDSRPVAWGVELTAESVPPEVKRTRLDVSFTLLETEAGAMTGAAIYSSELFERSTIQGLVDDYVALLRSVARGSDPRTVRTRRRGRARLGPPASVLDLVNEEIAARPDDTALEFGAERISYRDLGARSDEIATALIAKGVRREDRVAVAAKRGRDALAAVLGVWKARASYVPLDLANPATRNAAVLRQARVRVVLVDEDRRNAFEAFEAQVLPLVEVASTSSDTAAFRSPDARDLAYVVATSGTTGVPKGVMVEHRTLANLVSWLAPRLPVPRRVLHAVPLGFDMSLKEILSTLAAGQTLVSLPGLELTDVERVGDAVGLLGIDTLFVTPTLLHALNRIPAFVEATRERDILAITGGELLVLQGDGARPRLRIENHYGPSETHAVTFKPVDDSEVGPIAIGTEIPGVSIYILEDGRRVPTGAVGELHIAGTPLGRGYIGNPRLTAAQFVPDPFSGAAGARLYRTGDYGRRTEAGDIEFDGRRDRQIKVRGLRVELGEIESAMCDELGVRAAVVVPRENSAGGTRLDAYAVGAEVPVAVARARLATCLPERMLPMTITWLPELPLSINGKVALASLPVPDGAEFEAPDSVEERLIAEIWADLLDLEAVGRNDDFFALGGHSLLAVQAMFALSARLGAELPVYLLFETPTPASLAARSEVQHVREQAVID